MGFLVLLDTTSPVLLRVLDGRLVAPDLTLGHAQEALGRLERPLEVSDGRLAEQVDLHQVALQRALEGDDRLDQERVGVLEVQVHHAHHAHAHHLRLDELPQLLLVVLHDGRGHGARLLPGSQRRGLNVFERRHVYSCLAR